MRGIVVRNTGSWYTVKTDDGKKIDCKVKGNFRQKGIRSTNPVAVGDSVEIIPNKEGTAFITSIDDRRNYIVRRSQNLSKQSHILAANVDQALLMVTVNYPETSLVFVDRFLASAEAYAVPVVLLFNKIDLLDSEEFSLQEEMINLYTTIGYTCVPISAETGEGIDALLPLLKGKLSLLSGNSGVGKSTLINRLIPSANLHTSELSTAHNLGMHTTTSSEMLEFEPLGQWAALIDTPGIKGFGNFDMKSEQISHYFKEIFQFSKNCRFYNCTHTHEPGCAVLEAVENHYIAQSRYNSYISMLTEREDEKYRAPQ